MEAASASPAMKAAPVGAAAKAALSAEGVASRNTAMIEAAEGAGVRARHSVRVGLSMKRSIAAKAAAGIMVEVR
jgi:hypothetical protein